MATEDLVQAFLVGRNSYLIDTLAYRGLLDQALNEFRLQCAQAGSQVWQDVLVIDAVGNITAPAGIPGPAGPTGATGAAGATGSTGATGAAGVAGPAGLTAATVATAETQASGTAYADLATSGPAVTLTPTGTTAVVWLSCKAERNGVGNSAFMGVAVSGASTVAADDAHAVSSASFIANVDNVMSRVLILTGLTPGSNTFTAKYHNDGGSTWTFRNRSMAVFAP